MTEMSISASFLFQKTRQVQKKRQVIDLEKGFQITSVLINKGLLFWIHKVVSNPGNKKNKYNEIQ